MATASQLKLAGTALLVCGSLVAGSVALHPEGLRAPAWVAYLAAAVFVWGGAVALARAYSKPAVAEAFACLVLGGMFAIAAWISVGPGSRQCVASGSGGGVPELACRSAFGVGALILAAMLLVAVRGWLGRSSAG